MRFSKTDNIYKIIRITGSQDNILGVAFDDKKKCPKNSQNGTLFLQFKLLLT